MDMAKNTLPKYLGLRLEQAGLISAAQIQIALQDQIHYNHLELEEILTLRGWLKPETIDFFSNQISKLIKHSKRSPLIKCLKQAGLLTDEEITKLIETQKETGMVFDSLLVNLGYIKQSTIEFFQKYLVGNNSAIFTKDKSLPKIEISSIDPNLVDLELKQKEQENCKILSPDPIVTIESQKITNTETIQKAVKKQGFFDPKTTSSLKISLPRESFILSLRLNQAGLMSESQIEIAIQDRNRHKDLTLEEIIILRGWLKEKTLDFFLEKLPKIINQPKTLSLAQCLEQAGLVSKEKIIDLLQSQQETGTNFDSLVMELGYIKKATLNFFINYLVKNDCDDSSLKESPPQQNKISDRTPSLTQEKQPCLPVLKQEEDTPTNDTIESLDRDRNSNSIHWSEAKTIIGASPL